MTASSARRQRHAERRRRHGFPLRRRLLGRRRLAPCGLRQRPPQRRAGDDALYGFDGDDLLNGDIGNEYVEAGEGNDTVNGGADSDTILGQAGNDFLNGGAGFDYLYGGAGADIFSFRRGDSYDTGWDFSVAEGDRLRIDPATGVTSFAQFQALLTGFAFDAGDGRGLVQFSVLNVAALGSNDQITIGGMRPADWTAGIVDFL